MDNIQAYINQFDIDIQKQLNQLRSTIIESAPEAIEKISWGVPTYMLNGFLVQFAANKKHIGFYCSPLAIEHFQTELKPYKTNKKNTIQFLYEQELPIDLIKRIICYRIKENKKSATFQ